MAFSDTEEQAVSRCCPAPGPSADRCCSAPDARDVDWLIRVAKALSDPIRLSMLEAMAQGRACCGLPGLSERGVPGAADPAGICVCDFQEHFGIGQSKVSYHLRVLREAGLVREEARGKWTFHSIDGEAATRALDAFRDLMRV